VGRSVNLSVQVRRFKCINLKCSRTTLVEQIEAVAQAKQRRTVGNRLKFIKRQMYGRAKLDLLRAGVLHPN
jgi:transposase